MYIANDKKPGAEQNKRKQHQHDKSRRYNAYRITDLFIHFVIS